VGVVVSAAEPANEWDAAFTRTEGWTGGDVAGTVDLGQGRTLWLFGDTWIGSVEAGRHKAGSRLVNNSLAISQTNTNAPRTPEQLHFYWGPNSAAKHPTAWIVPDEKLFPPARNAEGKPVEHWFWTTGGGIVVPNEQGKPALFIALFHIARTTGKASVWNFESRGSVLAKVSNYRDPVASWQVEQIPIQHAISSQQTREQPTSKELSWGQALVLHEKWVYIYGVQESAPLVKKLFLARVATEQLSEMQAWEFYAGDDSWSKQFSAAQAVADRGVNEFSVERMTHEHQSRWIMVQSEPNLGRHIWIRTANTPQGPWSTPQVVHEVQEVERNSTYFTYAAKGHASLAEPGELLVSYVVNAHDFSAMLNDASIYRPRFVRIPLKEIRTQQAKPTASPVP
jgi:hypothetical protein